MHTVTVFLNFLQSTLCIGLLLHAIFAYDDNILLSPVFSVFVVAPKYRCICTTGIVMMVIDSKYSTHRVWLMHVTDTRQGHITDNRQTQ